MRKKYDWLIVGAGLFGTTFAREMTNKGFKCLIVEKDDFIGGNCASETKNGIEVHKFGAHIFHTNDLEVWKWINKYSSFNNFVNSPVAEYNGKIYNLPFNMNTFCQIFEGVTTPNDAKRVIKSEIEKYGVKNPKNLEEQAISLVGETIFDILIKGYTEKQWGRPCKELPASIIKRLPVRFTFDNNFFNARYQGIPEIGYTKMIEKIINGVYNEKSIDYQLNADFLKNREYFENLAENVLFTGPIDAFFNYKFGNLEYRSLRFETVEKKTNNFQGVAVKNFTSADVPYTRVIEHKHFMFDCTTDISYVTYEYPDDWKVCKREYYPIRNETNIKLLNKYINICPKNVHFGGRLGMYEYNDMDTTIRKAIDFAKGI
jgi:UDP-galactopyranose mutase